MPSPYASPYASPRLHAPTVVRDLAALPDILVRAWMARFD